MLSMSQNLASKIYHKKLYGKNCAVRNSTVEGWGGVERGKEAGEGQGGWLGAENVRLAGCDGERQLLQGRIVRVGGRLSDVGGLAGWGAQGEQQQQRWWNPPLPTTAAFWWAAAGQRRVGSSSASHGGRNFAFTEIAMHWSFEKISWIKN